MKINILTLLHSHVYVGYKLNPALRIFAYIYGNLAKFLKLDKNFAPTGSEKGYFDESFERML